MSSTNSMIIVERYVCITTEWDRDASASRFDTPASTRADWRIHEVVARWRRTTGTSFEIGFGDVRHEKLSVNGIRPRRNCIDDRRSSDRLSRAGRSIARPIRRVASMRRMRKISRFRPFPRKNYADRTALHSERHEAAALEYPTAETPYARETRFDAARQVSSPSGRTGR